MNIRTLITALVLTLAAAVGAADADKTASIKSVKKADVDQYLAGLKGKVVIVDFWATWCPPCRMEIPGFVELQKKFADKGLVVVGLSLDESPEPVKAFCKENGVNYPVFVVGEDTTSAWGNVENIPTTFIIDKNGKKIGDPHVGLTPKEEFEKLIVPLLK